MKSASRVSPVPAPASGDRVAVCISEEKRLALADVPLWVGGWTAALAAAVLAWMGARMGKTPLVQAALGLTLGLALLAIGLGIARLSGWFARCFHAAGFSLLVIALAVAVCRDGSLHPLLGLAFLAVASATAVALLGSRPGAVALAIGVLAGGAVTAPLEWKESSGGLLFPLILMVLFPWTWRRGWFAPLMLAASGFTVGMVLCGRGDGGLIAWISGGALVAGAFLLARMEPYVQGIAWPGAGFAMALIVAGPLSPLKGLEFGLALAMVAWLTHWGAVRPARWTALAAVSGLAIFLLVTSSGGVDVDRSGPALAASFLYLGAAWLTARRGSGDEASSLAVAPLAVATAAFAALALALEIGRGWPGIAAAILTPLLVLLAVKLRLPDLGALAIVSALFSLAWMLFHWDELGFPGSSRDTPWLLYGFGVPFLAIAAAVWIARRGDAPRFTARMAWVAVVAGMLLAVLLVRQLVPSATTSWLVAASLAPLFAFAAYRRFQRRTAA